MKLLTRTKFLGVFAVFALLAVACGGGAADVHRLPVPDLPDVDHVRIAAQHVVEGGRERHPLLTPDRHLDDTGDACELLLALRRIGARSG